MSYERRILYHGADPYGPGEAISGSAVRSCWFELHRQGGCGAGQLALAGSFAERGAIEIGDWISFELSSGVRWYLGRVEERRAEVPAGIRLRLEGMAIELNETFPGGFGVLADGRRPHVYAATDLFDLDPDYGAQTFDVANSADDVVRLLMAQYQADAGHVQIEPGLIEPPRQSASVKSLKLRGEESLRSVLKDLALRAQSASWGVDEQGLFFFLCPRESVQATYRERRDLSVLNESRDLSLLYNRLLLTGDYVYDHRDQSDDLARRSYRWRGTYVEPDSREQFGDRRIRLWLPWVRTQQDSVAFAREFFRQYSRPVSRFYLETTALSELPFPWRGRVRIEDRDGGELITAHIETVRVLFDQAPRFRMELGPEDPRDLWPEPLQDERWELPENDHSAGGDISRPTSWDPDSSPGGGGGTESGGGGGTQSDSMFPLSSSDGSSDAFSDVSSDDLSENSSEPLSSDEGATGSDAGGGDSWPLSDDSSMASDGSEPVGSSSSPDSSLVGSESEGGSGGGFSSSVEGPSDIESGDNSDSIGSEISSHDGLSAGSSPEEESDIGSSERSGETDSQAASSASSDGLSEMNSSAGAGTSDGESGAPSSDTASSDAAPSSGAEGSSAGGDSQSGGSGDGSSAPGDSGSSAGADDSGETLGSNSNDSDFAPPPGSEPWSGGESHPGSSWDGNSEFNSDDGDWSTWNPTDDGLTYLPSDDPLSDAGASDGGSTVFP